MPIRTVTVALLAAALALSCGADADEDATIPLGEGPDTAGVVVAWPEGPELSAEDIERGRLDMSWRRAAEADTTGAPSGVRADTAAAPADTAGPRPAPPAGRAAPAAPVRIRSDTLSFPETYDDLASLASVDSSGARRASRDTMELPPVSLPLHGDVQGPSVLVAQVLLDRSPFSPGILDGKWGRNTEKAIYWLQKREGLEPTGAVDSTTFQRLYALAGRPDRYTRRVALTADDVAGPFTRVPGDIYAQAELDCVCYESTREKVAERYHAAPDLLERLNPGVDLTALEAGDSLDVPNVEKSRLSADGETLASPGGAGAGARTDAGGRPAGPIARIVISAEGFYLHVLDADGRILHHFPTTLGSEYAPSPEGDFSVSSIAFAPWFHWKPALLTGEDPSKPDARIPPGPNSPVGLVWMQLSKPHYGIHGTSAPETIGYVSSHGCVRLTNWDAIRLARMISAGVPVRFRDVSVRGGGQVTRSGR